MWVEKLSMYLFLKKHAKQEFDWDVADKLCEINNQTSM